MAFERGYGSVTYVVVQVVDCARDDTLGFIPRCTLLQDGFDCTAEEQSVEDPFGFLVEE